MEEEWEIIPPDEEEDDEWEIKSTYDPNLADERSSFQPELDDPQVRELLAASTKAEVGGQPLHVQKAYMETVLNRAKSRNMSLTDTVLDSSYYPSITHQRMGRMVGNFQDEEMQQLDSMIDQVVKGSNISNYATGNESMDVHSGGAPVSYNPSGEYEGPNERFVQENADAEWVKKRTADAQEDWEIIPSSTGGTLTEAQPEEEWEIIPPSGKKSFYATEEEEKKWGGRGPADPSRMAEEAAAKKGATPSQAKGAANRDRLFNAIADVEEQGYTVPHFIGTDNEPEGDRAPTRDMEQLVGTLATQQTNAIRAGNVKEAARINKERRYWEEQIKTTGMSAEQWKKQTGEEDPRYPHEPAFQSKQSPEELVDNVQLGIDAGKEAWESTNKALRGVPDAVARGLQIAGLGLGETVNRYAYAPIVHGLREAIDYVAPGSDLASAAKKIDDAFYKNTVEIPAEQRRQLQAQSTKEGTASEIATAVGAMAGDLPVILATGGALPELKTGIQLLNTLRHGAASMTVPAMRAGTDAAEQVKREGGTEMEQFGAFAKTTAQLMAMGSIPMSTSSGAATHLGRFAERAAKSVPLASAAVESGRQLDNFAADIFGGKKREFSIGEHLKEALPMVLVGGAAGRSTRPSKFEQTFGFNPVKLDKVDWMRRRMEAEGLAKATPERVAEWDAQWKKEQEGWTEEAPAKPLKGREYILDTLEALGIDPNASPETKKAAAESIKAARTRVTPEESFAPKEAAVTPEAPPVDKTKGPSDKGDYLYHATHPGNRPSVLKEGTKPGSWFAKTPQEASAFAGDPRADKSYFRIKKSEIKETPAKEEDVFGQEFQKGGVFKRSAEGHKVEEVDQYGNPVKPAEKPAQAREVTPEAPVVLALEAPQSTAAKKWDLMVQRMTEEDIGQDILGHIIENDVSPQAIVHKFWNEAYPNLPDNAQKKFQRMIHKMTGFKPGDNYATQKNPDGTRTELTAKNWADLYPPDDAPAKGRFLQGEDRGLVVLMEMANQGMGQLKPTGPVSVKRSPQALGIVADPRAAKGFEAAREEAKNIADYLNKAEHWGPFNSAVGHMVAGDQKTHDNVMKQAEALKKLAPDEQARKGATMFREAGGNMGKLTGWGANVKDAAAKAAYRAAGALKPNELELVAKVSQRFKELRMLLNMHGIDVAELENYVTHMYHTGGVDPQTGRPLRSLSSFFKYAKPRHYDSYFAAIQAGEKPKTLDLVDILSAYEVQAMRAINKKKFVDRLKFGKARDGRSIVEKSSIRNTPEGRDYQTVDAPGLERQVVHPDHADTLRKMLGESQVQKWLNERTKNPLLNIGKGVLQLGWEGQKYAKGTMFSLSLFHHVTEGTHALGHRVNPFNLNTKEVNLNDPKQYDAAVHGLMLRPDRMSMEQFAVGVGGAGKSNYNLVTKFGRKFGGEAGKQMADLIDGYTHYLFESYIPRLKMDTYEHILERNADRFSKDLASGKVSMSEVKSLSADQANAAYGHLNYTKMARSRTVQDLMQIAFLAPDFFEARARFAAQAAKGLAGSKVGAEQLAALSLLALGQYVAARALNYADHGDAEWDAEHAFQVKTDLGGILPDKRWVGLRSVPEDIVKAGVVSAGKGNINKAAEEASQFFRHRLSPSMGLAGDNIFKHNWRGEKTDFGKSIMDLLSNVVPMPAQGFVNNITRPNEAQSISPFETMLKSLGIQIHRVSPLSETHELAAEWLKTNDPDEYARRQASTFPQSEFKGLRFALEDSNKEAARAEWKRLNKEKGKEGKNFQQSVLRPYTSSYANDQRFYDSLNKHDKAIFKAAIARRALILDRFQKWVGPLGTKTDVTEAGLHRKMQEAKEEELKETLQTGRTKRKRPTRRTRNSRS